MSALGRARRRAEDNATESTLRLALRREEAARALGISDESFDRYVRHELPVVRIGTLRLYPIEALSEWLRTNASAAVDDVRTAG